MIKVNGVQIKEPIEFSIERYKLTKAGRTADGNMQMELIAKKRKFNLKYEVLSGTDLETILNILDSDAVFYTLEYVENNVTKSAIVYPGALKYTKLRSGSEWYWKDITISLIER